MLAENGKYVIDGAMATELERRGADIDDPLWSAKILIESPGLIEAVHYDYFVAGADIALSASYQATFDGCKARGLDAAQTRRLLRDSVDLACVARERFRELPLAALRARMPLVAASIGAYGAHRHDGSEYRGDYGVGPRVMQDFHRRQLEVLASTRADFIAFETVPSLAEGEAIVRLLQEFPEVQAWLSFSCRDGERVCHGERFADCAALANEHAGIIAVGLNCTAPEHVRSLLSAAASVTRKPLLAYPNSGECWNAADSCWTGEAGEGALTDYVDGWLEAGAQLVGGCCRSTPADIAGIAAAINAR